MSTIKVVIARLRSNLLNKGEIALERPEVITAGRAVLSLILAFVLSGANIFGSYAPFGIAVVAISGAEIEGILALVGAFFGYLIRMGLIDGLKYISPCILVYAAAYVFRDIESYKKAWFMPAVASFMAMCTGFVYAADAGWSLETTVFFLTETILVGGSTYFYKIAVSSNLMKAEDEGEEIKIAVSLLILEATCLISISNITFFGGISFGRILAQITVMILSYKISLGIGCATGVAMGLAMDSCSGLGAPFYSMAYGFSGLLSGVFAKNSRFIFILAFILSNCVSVLWTWQSVLEISILYETFIVSVIFLILPTGLLDKVSLGMDERESYYGAVKVRKFSKDRVEQLSGSFRQLYITASKTEEKINNDNDVATIFDRAADKCCRKCKKKGECWHVGYESTLDAMNKATAPMMERGLLKARDLPGYFLETCNDLDNFIFAVNEELKALLYRRQFNNRIEETRETTLAQYSDMSTILQGVAAEMNSDLTFEPYAERKLKRYLKAIDVEAQAAVFRDRNGRLHAEVKSDNIRALTRDDEFLDKLSALLETRLCEKSDRNGELSFMEAEPLAAAVGIASVKKQGETVSGDKGTYFKTDEGILFIILSDGMGSGDEAAKESEETITILENFLKAGLDPKLALKILSSAITVRNEVNTGYATVDLFSINLFTGVTRIFKCGAAPSYLKKGKKVKAIKGESLAAGLLDASSSVPDEITLKLEPGHFAVIASDGVSVDGDDIWLRSLISEYRGVEPKELAKNILEKAIEIYGGEDDMTVMTVFLEERS